MQVLQNPLAGKGAPFGTAERAIFPDGSDAYARAFLAQYLDCGPTPLHELTTTAARHRLKSLAYKDEAGRMGLGSFKALGGAYAVFRIVEELALAGGVLDLVPGSPGWRRAAARLTFACATDGNHGRSVAAGARLAGARSVIFVHESVDRRRIEAIRAEGAEVRVDHGHYDAAVEAADAAASDKGWVLVSDTSYPGCERTPRLIMQGYTVLVAEAIEQAGQGRDCPFSHVFMQAGVGGLAAAVAAHFWERYGERRPTIVVVEPERADCLFQTARAGVPTAASGDLDTDMAMLACGRPSRDAWTILKRAGDFFLTLTDTEACHGRSRLRLDPVFGGRMPSSPSGSAGFAALEAAASTDARARLGLGAGSSVLVIGSEGPEAM